LIFFAGLNGSERANLVRTALEQINQTGAKAVSITCDGPSTHLTMMRELGGKLDPEDMKTYFSHPTCPNQRVHLILDLVHMLKLVRNSLATKKIIKSSSGEVKWDFIEKLHYFQEKEGLRAGTKLRSQHIEWERNKMKVNIAAQTLSASVAKALDWLREDLKNKDFQGSEATTEFIRLFDSLFDSFNSRNYLGKNFKAPLKTENQHEWISLYAEASNYIKSLKLADGTPVLESKIKTGFLGFLCGIWTFPNLFEDLVTKGPMNYILCYKFCQVKIAFTHVQCFSTVVLYIYWETG
jgi:hypothetical protein